MADSLRVADSVPRPPEPVHGSGGGNGYGDFRERLATLEEKSRHLATKEDVGDLKVSVEKLRSQFELVKWMLGIVIAGVSLALYRLFSS